MPASESRWILARASSFPGPVRPLARSATKLSDDRILVWKLTGFQFRVDQLVVDSDFEAATGIGLQFHRGDLLLELIEDLGGQTDRTRLVVSSGAISKVNLHGVLPVWKAKVDYRQKRRLAELQAGLFSGLLLLFLTLATRLGRRATPFFLFL